jgi:hypothetical protein
MVIFGDNQGALALANNPVFHPHLNYIDIHFTRELLPTGRIQVSQAHLRRP